MREDALDELSLGVVERFLEGLKVYYEGVVCKRNTPAIKNEVLLLGGEDELVP
jgi:hypothetical protein